MTHFIQLIRRLSTVLVLALPLWAAQPAWADDCGRAGQRACNIDERIPSCDVNLVEGGGMCVRPNCGAEGQRLCSIVERTTFNWVLMTGLPMPQPCDVDHKDIAGKCSHPACGREGQRACGIFERIPSCDLNLVENAGFCARPPLCGQLGQPLCSPTLRGITRMCDANLINRLGQCARPGTPGNTNGNTGAAPAAPPQPAPAPRANPPSPAPAPAGVQSGYVPPPPPAPRLNTPPPPPPPAPRLNTAPPPPPTVQPGNAPPPPAPASPPAAPAQLGGMQMNTDRIGADILGIDLAQADPAQCQMVCSAHLQCVAWSYVKPGIKGPAPRCFLKSAVPPATPDSCCVSGAKTMAKALLLKR